MFEVFGIVEHGMAIELHFFWFLLRDTWNVAYSHREFPPWHMRIEFMMGRNPKVLKHCLGQPYVKHGRNSVQFVTGCTLVWFLRDTGGNKLSLNIIWSSCRWSASSPCLLLFRKFSLYFQVLSACLHLLLYVVLHICAILFLWGYGILVIFMCMFFIVLVRSTVD